MEWVVGVLAVLVSFLIARWSDSRQEERHRTELEAAERRFQEELAEARRQWEETAGSIMIDGRYREHVKDRRQDVVEIVVSNSGRMPIWVDSVEVTDNAGLSRVPLRPPNGYPIKLEPSEPLKLETSRGGLEDNGRRIDHDPGRWWETTVVRVQTGDGRFFWWDPRRANQDTSPI